MTDPSASKRTVLAFYEQAVRRRDFTAAAHYLAPVLIQHRNDAADGADGLREFIDRMRTAYPRGAYEIKQVFSDGDYVILRPARPRRTRPSPGGAGRLRSKRVWPPAESRIRCCNPTPTCRMS